MSLNSLQDRMEQRAASMAQMAKRANNPQDIQAMQQRLTMEIQNGTIKPYIGIPLIQELTKRLGEVKAKAAMNVMGAQAPAQGGAPAAPAAPIAQQVMQQATQESQGLEALPSNLPQSYAGGGIIAFEGGGEVERYQNEGSTGTTPAGRYVSGAQQQVGNYFSGVQQQGAEYEEKQRLRNELISKYGPSAGFTGLFKPQSDADRQAAQNLMSQIDKLSLPQLQALSAQGPSALPTIAPVVTPNAAEPYVLSETDARLQALHGNKSYYGDGYGTTYDKGNVPQAKINSYMQANKGANQLLNTPPNTSATSRIPGAGSFKAPTLESYTPTAATLPDRAAPVLTDLNSFIKDLPKKTKEATEDAITKTQKTYEDMDKPGFEARESRLDKREAGLEKNAAITRALYLMNLGFGVAGSKERSVAGALGKEGREGIQNLIQGEAANRAARDKLEDYRDNLDIQKVQAKKGNYQAAQAAGDRAADNLYKYQNLNMTAASAGNTQAIQRYQAEQQGDIGKAGVLNQREQLNMSAVDQKNRNVLGLAGLDLQNRQLAQQGDLGRQNIAMQERRFNAMDKASQARLQQVKANASKDFTINVAPQLNAQFIKEYGPNWRTAQDARSLQAQMLFTQQQDAYVSQATGQAMDVLGARQADTLLLMGQ
jgi:hypothetical protein